MANSLTEFKEILHQGMITNFERDGFITPILFFFKNGAPVIGMIPPELLAGSVGKEILAGMIKENCQQPNVLAAGIIIEAYGAKIDENSPNKDKIVSGEIQVSELNEKQDIILMMFSTPEGDEMIAYDVDCKNKLVGDRFGDDDMKQFEGLFSNFFHWNKN